MCPTLGEGNQGSELHRLDRERVEFCGTLLSLYAPVAGRVFFLFSVSGHDDSLHDHWFRGRLRDPWPVASFVRDRDMLGSPICEHDLDV